MRLRTRGLFSIKRWRRVVADRLHGTPFDRALVLATRAGQRDFVFGWNRGLGDIALGLAPLFARIRAHIAGSRIILVTRPDLADMAALADVDDVVIVDALARDAPLDPLAEAQARGITFRGEPVVFANADPTRWLDGQRTAFPPRLAWKPAFDALASRFAVPDEGRIVIGAHVNSETAQYYGYVKDWPDASWRELIARFPAARGVHWILFGNAPTPPLAFANVTDLRGQTTLLELLALATTRCRVLIAPDSGILTAVYYLDRAQPLEMISLWSDPRQGILKQGCPSPNPSLHHRPLLGPNDDVRQLRVDDVETVVAAALAQAARQPAPEAIHAV